MLQPAILYKDILERKFAECLYTENYFYYTGYAGGNELPSIKVQDDYYQYAHVVNNSIDPYSEKVTGYFAYHIDFSNDTVDRFGLYSFEENNVPLIDAVFETLEGLCKVHRRIEWRVIGGNHVIRGYDKFCEKHGGNKVVLHSVTKDLNGNWRDEIIYEILNERK